jgi:hypothetical protein
MKISRLYDFLDTFDSSRSGLSLEKSSPSSFSVKNGSVSDADIFWEVNVMKQIRVKEIGLWPNTRIVVVEYHTISRRSTVKRNRSNPSSTR